jgi:hypothetical protein
VADSITFRRHLQLGVPGFRYVYSQHVPIVYVSHLLLDRSVLLVRAAFV